MYGLTRGLITLLGAGAAGLLIWLATQIDDHSSGGYWAVYGLIAAAGLTMALAQLLGGWTKGRLPRLSANVFLLGFLPVLVAAGWVILAKQPHDNWFRGHVLAWSSDISIGGLVRDLGHYVGVLAFGIGLTFGFSFDTAGAAARGPAGPVRGRRRAAGGPPPEDRPTTRERESEEAQREPQPERQEEPTREPAR
jgi:hypothetical protein